MNRDVMKGQWKQMQGEAKRRWAKLTDDELGQMEGNFDKLVGRIQERYGFERAHAEREVDDFLNGYKTPVETH